MPAAYQPGVPSRRYRRARAGVPLGRLRQWAEQLAALGPGLSVVIDTGPDHRVAPRLILAAVAATGGAGAFRSRETAREGDGRRMRRFWRIR